MKRIIAILLIVCSLSAIQAKPADEGMWIPMLLKNLDWDKLEKMGLKLTPEQIYDANKASMKDAIVWFGGFCTGEIISSEGLVLTNHHCGYDAIAGLSTAGDNILDNGFFAMNKGEERPVNGLWASILVRMEDVSDQILPNVVGLDERERNAKISEIIAGIEKKATEGTHYNASVRGFFNNNQFFLFIYERFTDIRLVGTPPQSIGKFGADTDNWVWPRHTGDFSMFRIYAGSGNKPAAYSTTNVPYKPKHSLPISVKGIQENDYAMVFGFPGRTNRYATSYEVSLAIDISNPAVVALRDARLKAMMAEMKKDVNVRLALSSQYAQIANYWKYFIGQTEQLQRLKVVEQKRKEEERFQEWAQDKPEYSNILNNLRTAYGSYRNVAAQSTYLNEGILGSSTMVAAFQAVRREEMLLNNEKMLPALNEVKTALLAVLETYQATIDKNIFAITNQMYYENINPEQHPELLKTIMKKYKSKSNKETFEKYAAYVLGNTIFNDTNKFNAFMAKPDMKKLMKDPAYIHMKAFYANYLERFKTQIDAFNATKNKEMRVYLKGMMEMDKNLVKYSDANSTLRLTYGKVSSYSPKDGVQYNYVTTANGLLEKYVPGDYEFDVPKKLLDLCAEKDFGKWADANGNLPVAFITDNDITGGNSGSPVINGNGELIGLAFDGNWEAMSGDISYDPKYKRCINVDIRYVLFVVEKYHGAVNIINELNLVK
jgi:V8-like Glu-specific endopeptidase